MLGPREAFSLDYLCCTSLLGCFGATLRLYRSRAATIGVLSLEGVPLAIHSQ